MKRNQILLLGGLMMMQAFNASAQNKAPTQQQKLDGWIETVHMQQVKPSSDTNVIKKYNQAVDSLSVWMKKADYTSPSGMEAYIKVASLVAVANKKIALPDTTGAPKNKAPVLAPTKKQEGFMPLCVR
jgi:mRNA-degrading endonuclease HigB of HigAB toxin-antitoxin module